MAALVDPQTYKVIVAGKELLRLALEKTDRLKAELGHQGPDLNWDP
jgi:hypothetical protein